MIRPNCGDTLIFSQKTDDCYCNTCTFPICPTCGETLNSDDDVDFLEATGRCPYCDGYFNED